MTPQTVTDLDFLSASVHGRRSRLAEADRLDALCRVRSIAELARVLFPEARLYTAVDLQRRLVWDQVLELARLAEQTSGAAARLLDWLTVRFQMENLKVLARGFAAGMSLEDLRPHLVGLPGELALEVEVIASADSIEAFAAAIPSEPLRAGLEPALQIYEQHPKPFFVEAGLDLGYLTELLARTRRLPRRQRAGLLALAHQEADGFHLMLVARGKFHYDLEPDLLAPFHVAGAGIDRQAFAAMAGASGLGEVAERAVGRAIDAIPATPRERIEPADLEACAWNRFYRLANRCFRRSHMGLGAIVAYAAIRRVELANLITLSEGIRAGLAPRAIRRRLIPRSGQETARV